MVLGYDLGFTIKIRSNSPDVDCAREVTLSEAKPLKSSVRVRRHSSTQEVVECPYCKLQGRGGTMKRWHFDNCKNKAPLDQLE